MKEIKFDFNDILIIPAAISDIETRTSVNILDENNMLPIFTAPMFDVVNEENSDLYNENGIYSIIPRKNEYKPNELVTNNPKKFLALGLDDFIDYFCADRTRIVIGSNKTAYILIDIANGNMSKLINAVKISKRTYGSNLVLMVGNIANPETYKVLSDAGADFIRCGIGNGSVCTTTANSSLGAPMGSLIRETYEMSLSLKNPAKIIADGGISSFSDAIKALALGADFIMSGSMLNKSLESSGQCFEEPRENCEITNQQSQILFEHNMPVYKEYKGMSTKQAQKQMGNTRIKTAEGIVKYNKVEYTLSGWVENFSDFLKSNMSYCNKSDLKDFIGNVEYNFITYNAFLRYNK